MQEGTGATREHAIQTVLHSEGRRPEPLAGHVELLRTKAGILVRAHLGLQATETCSRCLRPLQDTLAIDFEEEFQATFDAQTGQPLTQLPDRDAFVIDSNHQLDLTEAVRQYREAVAAIATLCRADCKGLCPRCGSDLNTGDCGCEEAEVDERLAALAALLEQDAGEPAPATPAERRRGKRDSGRTARRLANSSASRRKD
jgi:uncharacterized protein